MFEAITQFIFYNRYECIHQPAYAYVLGVALCLGGIISYIPQYYSLIKSGSHKGLSEFSLLFLNVGAACLAANSFILNYARFQCYSHCSFWLCTANLLSFLQIAIGWLMVLPLYLIFVRFKLLESRQERILNDVLYVCVYLIFIILMVIFGIAERALSADSRFFFGVAAKVLGGLSTIFSCVVWLPQIYKLVKTQRPGSLSLAMFLMQTPGNVLIIILQILYGQSWSTWLTYVVTLAEQATIVVLLLYFRYRDERRLRTYRANLDEERYLVNNDYYDDE